MRIIAARLLTGGSAVAQLPKEQLALLRSEAGERLLVHLLDRFGRSGAEQVPVALNGDLVVASLGLLLLLPRGAFEYCPPAYCVFLLAALSSRPKSRSKNPM